jgi:hypothetical protein
MQRRTEQRKGERSTGQQASTPNSKNSDVLKGREFLCVLGFVANSLPQALLHKILPSPAFQMNKQVPASVATKPDESFSPSLSTF